MPTTTGLALRNARVSDCLATVMPAGIGPLTGCCAASCACVGLIGDSIAMLRDMKRKKITNVAVATFFVKRIFSFSPLGILLSLEKASQKTGIACVPFIKLCIERVFVTSEEKLVAGKFLFENLKKSGQNVPLKGKASAKQIFFYGGTHYGR